MDKDIYEILNDCKIDLDEINRVDLDDIEIKKIKKNIKKFKNKNKKIMSCTAVAACMLIVIGVFNNDLREGVWTGLANVSNYISGNTKTDYSEIVNDVAVEKDNGKIEVLNVNRDQGVIKLRYKLTFDEDISELSDIENDSSFGYCDKENSSKISTNIFVNSDDLDTVLGNKDVKNDDEFRKKLNSLPYNMYNIKQISVDKNELVEELELDLKDSSYNEPLNVKIQCNSIKLKDKTINGPWSIEYTINANNYDGEIDKHNINIPVSFKDNSSINIDSYSYTNTGLKIYATDTTSQEILDKFAEENQWLKDFVNYGGFTFPTIFFKGTDNLGNNYLFYPGGDKEEPKKITFRIYEPENNSAGYATEINKDATEIKLVLNQKDDNNYNVDIPLTDPITIKLK